MTTDAELLEAISKGASVQLPDGTPLEYQPRHPGDRCPWVNMIREGWGHFYGAPECVIVWPEAEGAEATDAYGRVADFADEIMTRVVPTMAEVDEMFRGYDHNVGSEWVHWIGKTDAQLLAQRIRTRG